MALCVRLSKKGKNNDTIHLVVEGKDLGDSF